ncbi:E3 SUMO-protein ligase PIAS1 [Pelomyxa schiedti]|nr:E3 SUMO-protein ligase PIAS1 [Pelomyxa schiedti]
MPNATYFRNRGGASSDSEDDDDDDDDDDTDTYYGTHSYSYSSSSSDSSGDELASADTIDDAAALSSRAAASSTSPFSASASTTSTGTGTGTGAGGRGAVTVTVSGNSNGTQSHHHHQQQQQEESTAGAHAHAHDSTRGSGGGAGNANANASANPNVHVNATDHGTASASANGNGNGNGNVNSASSSSAGGHKHGHVHGHGHHNEHSSRGNGPYELRDRVRKGGGDSGGGKVGGRLVDAITDEMFEDMILLLTSPRHSHTSVKHLKDYMLTEQGLSNLTVNELKDVHTYLDRKFSTSCPALNFRKNVKKPVLVSSFFKALQSPASPDTDLPLRHPEIPSVPSTPTNQVTSPTTPLAVPPVPTSTSTHVLSSLHTDPAPPAPVITTVPRLLPTTTQGRSIQAQVPTQRPPTPPVAFPCAPPTRTAPPSVTSTLPLQPAPPPTETALFLQVLVPRGQTSTPAFNPMLNTNHMSVLNANPNPSSANQFTLVPYPLQQSYSSSEKKTFQSSLFLRTQDPFWEEVLQVTNFTGGSHYGNFVEFSPEHTSMIARGCFVHLRLFNTLTGFDINPQWCQSILINGFIIPPRKGQPKSKTPRQIFTCQPVIDITNHVHRGRNLFICRYSLPDPWQETSIACVIQLVIPRPVERVMALIPRRNMFAARSKSDDDCLELNFQVSLKCALTRGRIAVPVKGINCLHAQCMDANGFLEFCNQSRTWMCAVCDKPCPFQDLVIDEWFCGILKQIPNEETSSVTINLDGTPVISSCSTASTEGADADAESYTQQALQPTQPQLPQLQQQQQAGVTTTHTPAPFFMDMSPLPFTPPPSQALPNRTTIIGTGDSNNPIEID